MENFYSYDELASILGCSRTAIAKKVRPDINNPGVERYKERYEVVIKDGKKCIVLDDIALEEEKNKSRGFRNVSNGAGETPVNVDKSGFTGLKDEKKEDLVISVTERYIEKFITFQQYMNEELVKRDKQILLLTNSENNNQNEYFRANAENKELKEKYNVMEKKYNVALNVIRCFITFALVIATGFITFKFTTGNVSNVQQPAETVIQPDTSQTIPVNRTRR